MAGRQVMGKTDRCPTRHVQVSNYSPELAAWRLTRMAFISRVPPDSVSSNDPIVTNVIGESVDRAVRSLLVPPLEVFWRSPKLG
jgi:hypothetical protein